MTNMKEEWNMEMALDVLANKDVDSKTWAEAVEWLMLYGPPEIKEILGQASYTATSKEFPDLEVIGYTEDGQPLYDIKKLAETLGISMEEAGQMLANKEIDQGTRHLFSEDETHKIQ